jgi:hypothetical protein
VARLVAEELSKKFSFSTKRLAKIDCDKRAVRQQMVGSSSGVQSRLAPLGAEGAERAKLPAQAIF